MPERNTLILYRRLLRYIRPYWKMVLLTLLALVVAAGMEPLMPALLKPLVDDSLIAKDPDAIRTIPLLLIAVFVVKGLAEYASKVASEWIAHRAILDIRADLFAKLNRLPQAVHDQYGTGKLLSKITYDVPQVGNTLSEAWIVIIRDSLIVLALLAYLFYVSWELTLLILVLAPVLAWIIDRASRLMRHASTEMQNNMGQLTHQLEEALNGHRDIKIYGAESYEEKRFWQVAETLRRHTMKVVSVAAANVPLVQVIAAIALAGVIYVASLLSAENKFTPGEFIAYVTAMAMIFEPIRRLTNINRTVQQGMAAAQSIFALLDLPDEANPGTLKPPIKGDIRFNTVTFAYPGSDRPALDRFTLHLPQGKTTALVGPSGSGKTTVVQLLARFYAPQSGIISCDGIDIQQIELGWWRRHIALVSQQVVLFDDTVAANIAYGRSDVSEAQIIAAAKAAHAWEFIQRLPQGLHTRIGDNGSQLSGGQRQRIALARAFLKDAPILILDEATSALDNESEQAVQAALETLRQGRTVLIIAHRLSTIESADQIAVLEQGRLVELGTHSDLLQRNGRYAQLYRQAENAHV